MTKKLDDLRAAETAQIAECDRLESNLVVLNSQIEMYRERQDDEALSEIYPVLRATRRLYNDSTDALIHLRREIDEAERN